MRVSFIILLGCLLISSACTQGLEADTEENKAKSCGSDTIPVEDALSALDTFLSLTNIKTKSEMKLISEDDVFTIGAQELDFITKSGEESSIPDTLLYAVNFADGGFAVMSANKELNSQLLCVTDQGNISPKCFALGNLFLKATEAELQTKTLSEEDIDNSMCYDAGKDYLFSLLISASVLDYFDAKTIYDIEPETKETGNQLVGPLIKTKWTQDEPFDDIKDPPGCAVIAAGQIMAYNEKPAITEFTTLSINCTWEHLKKVYPYTNWLYNATEFHRTQAARFAAELGNSNNCNVNSSGGTTINKVRDTFEKFGYNVSKRIGCQSGDINRISRQIIEEKKPIYMRGDRYDSASDEQKGHAWVIDGVADNMFHINWGWHGDCDGYFVKGIFNTADVQSYDFYDPKVATMARNYYHNFKYLLY